MKYSIASIIFCSFMAYYLLFINEIAEFFFLGQVYVLALIVSLLIFVCQLWTGKEEL